MICASFMRRVRAFRRVVDYRPDWSAAMSEQVSGASRNERGHAHTTASMSRQQRRTMR
jgi:hypothetical protein